MGRMGSTTSVGAREMRRMLGRWSCRRLQGQHALLDYRRAFLAVPAEELAIVSVVRQGDAVAHRVADVCTERAFR
jgi:hypothetical protein